MNRLKHFICWLTGGHQWTVTYEYDEFGSLLCQRCGRHVRDYIAF